MKKNRFKEMSDEHLLRNRKAITILMALMVVVIFVLLTIVAIQLYRGRVQFSNIILPVALFPILIVNLINLRGLKEEIRQRGLSS